MARRCPFRSNGSCPVTSSSISSTTRPSPHWSGARPTVALTRSMGCPCCSPSGSRPSGPGRASRHRVLFPRRGDCLALAFVTPWAPYAAWPWPDWRTAPVAALIAGGVFLLLYLGGQFVFGTEAFGFGDVKLAVFIGMATGLSSLRMVHALLYGVFLGGVVAIILLITPIRGLREAGSLPPALVLLAPPLLLSSPPPTRRSLNDT